MGGQTVVFQVVRPPQKGVKPPETGENLGETAAKTSSLGPRGAFDYWCTSPSRATSKWRFFAAQNSDNEKLEKPDRNDLRLGRALRMAPVPSKTNGQNLTYRI